MDKTLEPMNDRVIVRPDKVEEVTKGGLILPNLKNEKSSSGTVVAFSSAIIDSPLYNGARIIYAKSSGTDVDLNGETLIAMRVSDIFAVVEPKVASPTP